MDLSIIIPMYNVEKYLDRCIQSLVKHNLKNTEIILVDDGSPDNSGKIAEAWAEKYDYIKVFHTENHGLAEARNFGIKQACGKYVTFIDSDDYVEDDFIKLYSHLNTNVDIIFVGYIAEYLQRTKTICYPSQLVAVKDDVIDKCFEVCSNKNSAWCKIVKKQFLVDNNLWFISGFAEDYNWIGRAIMHAQSALVLPLNYYHYIAERSDSIMNVYKIKRLYDIISMSNSILDEANKLQLKPQQLKKIKQFVGFNIISNFRIINRLSANEQNEAVKLLKQNKHLLKTQKSLVMKIFVLGAKVFGFKFMYKFAKI